MIYAVKTFGTLRAAEAILQKNKRASTKFTRRKLKKLRNWPKWQQSEFKQLNQYYDQHMFGEPYQLPPGANILDLLWMYLVKTDNAFTEANVPDIPRYVRVDTQYKEWYKHHIKKEIPEGYVLSVYKALQCHPEGLHLWAIHIDKIL